MIKNTRPKSPKLSMNFAHIGLSTPRIFEIVVIKLRITRKNGRINNISDDVGETMVRLCNVATT